MLRPVQASLGFSLALAWTAPVFAQTTERVSVDSNGVEGNGHSSHGVISANGRWVAFVGGASNLVPGDTNGKFDVFVHSRVTGQTTRVSVNSSGVQGDGDSGTCAISADGRYVAFESAATNLVPGDTLGFGDVFVRDRQTGQTTRVSVDSSGVQGFADSGGSWISADGRHVGFWSKASNLVAGDTADFEDIFFHDRQTGVTTRESVGTNGSEAFGTSVAFGASPDARYVAFECFAMGIVPGDHNPYPDIYVRDRQTNITECVSVNSNGLAVGGEFAPAISPNGRWVAFASFATTLVPGDTNDTTDMFVRDRDTSTTTRVSVDSNGGQADDASLFRPAISEDGRYVAFESNASNLVAGQDGVTSDIYLHDRLTGETSLVSRTSSGGFANGSNMRPSITPDARLVAFFGDASNLVPGDTNGMFDVFVRDRGTAALSALSCFGDGAGTPCPCGNSGHAGRGCANSSGKSGLLTALGSTSVANDTLSLTSTGMMAGSYCIFRQGTAQLAGGLGVLSPGTDGLDCVGGMVVRLGRIGTLGGTASISHVASLGGVPVQGGVLHYQSVYRNQVSFCTPATLNGSNALTVAWVP